MANQGLDWERKLLQKIFPNLQGNWDMYMAFFELALSQGLVVSFITPDKWLSKPFGEKFREIQMRKRLSFITRAGSKVFLSATVDAIVTIFCIESKTLKTARFINKNTVQEIAEADISLLEKPYLIDYLFSAHASIIQKIEKVSSALNSYALCENACATSDFYVVKGLIQENAHPDPTLYYKLINTGTIEKYRNKWLEKEISYGGKYRYPTVSKKAFDSLLGKSYVKRASQPKIIFKGLNLLDGCLDENAVILPGKSTIVICSHKIPLLKFLLGFLNSKLPIFYIKVKYASSSYCGGITFSKEMINDIPLSATPSQQQPIINLVDKILSAKKANPNADTSKWEKQIDVLVYDLYGLNEDEIRIIEG